MRRRVSTRSLATFVAIAATSAHAQVVATWTAGGPGAADFTFVRDSAFAHDGRTSVRLTATDEPTGFGGISTMLDGARYAGRHVHATAWLRTRELRGQGAALWSRVDGVERNIAFATTQSRQLITGTRDWTPLSIDIDVPANAQRLFVGTFSLGEGTLWVDDVHIETTPADPTLAVSATFEEASSLGTPPATAAALAASPREAPQALTPRGLANVGAFTRLVGYVRFFHPSDAAATTNWDEFTVRGMRIVERAPTPDSLASTLRALFAVVAPTVGVYRTGTTPPPAPAPVGDAIVVWQHFGYQVPTVGGAGGESPYVSRRVRIVAPNGRAPTTIADRKMSSGETPTLPVPDPATPFRADLGGGVSASVPRALYTTSPTVDSIARPRAVTERFALKDRATRLADVALLWMIPEHFYPYHELAHTEWNAALGTALTAAATDSNGTAFDRTLQTLVAALHDGHGNAFRASTARVVPPLELAWVEGRVVVTAISDSVARFGMNRGDEIVAVDDRPIASALRDAESRTSGATPQWIRTVALSRLLTGEPGTPFTLRVRDPLTRGAPVRTVHLVRGIARIPDGSRPAKIAELRPGVFYVDIGRVTDTDITGALPSLVAAQAIVFDMRGYPSQVSTPAILAHLIDSTIHSPHFEVPFVAKPDHADMQYPIDDRWTIAPEAPRIRGKIVWLTGGGAISYAESTMGVVEDNHLGTIVGSTTAGTNGDVNPFTLPGGYTVVWTGLRVRKNDGSPHHGVGIAPSVHVEPTLAGIRAGRDEVLERALSLVSPAAVP